MASQFWIGSNGNVYATADNGVTVKDYGQPTGAISHMNQLSGVETAGGSVQGRLINDPNPQTPNAAAPTNPTGATTPALNAGAVTNTQLAIDQIAPLLQAALASEATNHQNSVNTFNQQEQGQQQQHDTGTTTNQQNYDANFMDSIRAGIHGLGGLFSLLRGSGAGGGTAEDIARDTVGGTTANDIRTGADTQKENQAALDTSLGSFLTDLKQKRQQNDDTFTNNTRAIRRDSNTQLQDLYSKMAGYFGDAGDTGTASDYLGKAGALTPDIAANSQTQVSPYDTTPVIVHAPNLTAFTPSSQPETPTVPTDGQVGSGIFTMADPRRRKDTTAPVAVPAGA